MGKDEISSLRGEVLLSTYVQLRDKESKTTSDYEEFLSCAGELIDRLRFYDKSITATKKDVRVTDA